MAVPILAAAVTPILSTIVGAGASWFTVRTLDSLIGPTFDISRYATQLRQQFDRPIILPSPEQTIRAWFQRKLNLSRTMHVLKSHGIFWQGDTDPNLQTGNSLFWDPVISALEPRLDLSNYLRWYWQGRLGGPPQGAMELRDRLRHAGFSRPDEQQLFIDQYEDLPLELLIYLTWHGQLSDDDFSEYLKRLGIRKQSDRELLQARYYQTPPPEAMLEIARREKLDDLGTSNLLEATGWKKSPWAAPLAKLRNRIPPWSDLVQMAVKEAWSEDVVAAYDYDAERPPEFDEWLSRQGYGWGEGIGDNPRRTWPELVWRSHWRNLAPEHAFAFLHRLRPLFPGAEWSVVPGVKAWTLDDVRRVLKINDYAPAFRDRLAAISYRVNRLVDIRWALEYNLRDRAWAVESFQDRGHKLEDAEFLADIGLKRKEEKEQRPAQRRRDRLVERQIKLVLERLKLGTLQSGETHLVLVGLGLSEEEAKAAIRFAGDELELAVQKDTFARVRGDFRTGCLTEDQARERLRAVGVWDDRIDWWLRVWKLTLSCRQKTFTSERVLQLFRDGLLTWAQASARLANLGWQGADLLLLGAETQRSALVDQAKLLKAQQQTQVKAADQLERLIRQRRADQAKAVAALRRTSPISLLKKLAKKGRVSERRFRSRLELGGYTPEEIDLHWQDVSLELPGRESNGQQKQEEEQEPAQASSQPGT